MRSITDMTWKESALIDLQVLRDQMALAQERHDTLTAADAQKAMANWHRQIGRIIDTMKEIKEAPKG